MVGGGVMYNESDCYVFLGEWLNIWGHAITDSLKKIWILERLKDRRDNIKMVVFKPFIGDYSSNFIELLDIIGIKINQIYFISQPTYFSKIIVPDDSIVVKNNYRYYYTEYKDLINKIRDSIPVIDESPKKIYFTRTGLKKGGRDYGEKAVEKAFKESGYTIYSPECLSLKEQLRILRNCKVFATTEGSVAHNVIFCNDQVNIIVLRKISGLISYQFMLMDIRNANVTYIDTFATPFFMFAFWYGPFFLCIRKNLIRFLADNEHTVINQYYSLVDLLRYLKNICWCAVRARKIPKKSKNFKFYWRNFIRILIGKSV